ncbi:MAG: dTDP-glucose 4,6-dehydratase [Polyangiaceae bacterium]
MKILVTGGAGFIGSSFLSTLVPRHPEHSFVCFDKLTYAGNLLSLAAVEGAKNFAFERGDIADPDAVHRLFEQYGPDVVVHFAAESHVDRSIHDPAEFVRTNVMGTLHLLNACKAAWKGPGPYRFHHVSTDEVYGSLHSEGEHAFTEDSHYDPSSPYAASKASSDHLVRAFQRTFGLPVTITNCSNNYGPRQAPEKLIPLTMLNALDGRELPVYGTGSNRRDWLYVEDHCDAIWAVLERGVVGQTYNVGGGDERSNIELVRTMCQLVAEETGRPAESVLGLIRFVEDRPGHDWRYAIDSAKIHGKLGWAPGVRLAEGLRATLRWYMQNPAWVESMRSGEHRLWVEKNYDHRLRQPGSDASDGGTDR